MLSAAVALLLLVVAGPARAAPVPAPLFVKIVMAAVSFDHSIDTRFGDRVVVGVVSGSARAKELKSVLDTYADKTLKGKPIEVKLIDAEALAHSHAADIVFFPEPLGSEARKWAERVQAEKITAISADEAGVAAGLALGVELDDNGKPKLLINLDAAKAAGANFSAQVLKLARLVEGP